MKISHLYIFECFLRKYWTPCRPTTPQVRTRFLRCNWLRNGLLNSLSICPVLIGEGWLKQIPEWCLRVPTWQFHPKVVRISLQPQKNRGGMIKKTDHYQVVYWLWSCLEFSCHCHHILHHRILWSLHQQLVPPKKVPHSPLHKPE